MNSINLTGRLTQDPELSSTAKDKPVCDIRLAVDTYGGGVTFVDVKSYGNGAKAAGERLHKGDQVEVTGELRLDQWEAKDGSGKRSKHYIVGRIGFLQLRKQGDEAAADSQEDAEVAPESQEDPEADPSNIPF